MCNKRENIMKENYLQPRRNPTDAELQLHLIEVNNVCPLCGCNLRKEGQRKPGARLFDIAHIYPNSPTTEQLETLRDVELLGDNSESFENKIALCKPCHTQQDYHTSKIDYEKLVSIKKRLNLEFKLKEISDALGLEKDIKIIIGKLVAVKTVENVKLNYSAVQIADKFTQDDDLLKNKIKQYIDNYYYFIKQEFQNLDETPGFSFETLSLQVRAAFMKFEKEGASKIQIFDCLVDWIYNKTTASNKIACEAIISFFVQNCEVFREISK